VKRTDCERNNGRVLDPMQPTVWRIDRKISTLLPRRRRLFPWANDDLPLLLLDPG